MYQADNQNDNVIEYAGRENNLSKEKEYLIFVNPDTGKEKKSQSRDRVRFFVSGNTCLFVSRIY